MERAMPNMHVYEWDSREIAAFNAVFSRDPCARRLLNHWPERTGQFFILSWTTNGVYRSAVHFCEGEANWRAAIYRDAGTDAKVERRFIGQGESYAIVDGRQRSGCKCENCEHHTGDLMPIPKPKTMSSAKARKLAHAQALDRSGQSA